MSSARGRGNGDDDMTEYERQKWEQVARNKDKMKSLRLQQLRAELQPDQPNKRPKVILVQ
jgi:sensor histidine kinase YesM